MYAKVGKFRPGDKLIGKINPMNRSWPVKGITVIGIKRRRQTRYNMYQLQCRAPNGQLYKISKYVTYIDIHFQLSLKNKLKNL